jgi:hypothetical protein
LAATAELLLLHLACGEQLTRHHQLLLLLRPLSLLLFPTGGCC